MKIEPYTVQTIFALFYAIMWGSLANVWSRWRAFDWSLTAMPNGRAQTYRRAFLSLGLLNILPIVFFICVWLCLKDWRLEESLLSIGCKLLVTMLQPLALFGFYWMWISIVQWCTKTFYPGNVSSSYRYKGLSDDDLNPTFACRNFCFGLGYIVVPLGLLVFTLYRCH